MASQVIALGIGVALVFALAIGISVGFIPLPLSPNSGCAWWDFPCRMQQSVAALLFLVVSILVALAVFIVGLVLSLRVPGPFPLRIALMLGFVLLGATIALRGAS